MIDEEVERIWNDFWVPILQGNGELDLDKVKAELYDYKIVMEEVSKVYDHITNGRISKPNTQSDVVISETEDCYFWLYNNRNNE